MIFSFYLLLEYKTTERATGNFVSIRKTAFTWKRNMASHTNTLHGRSMFKNMVSFWTLKEKQSLFTVKICSVKVLYLGKKLTSSSLYKFCGLSFQITVIYITIINSSVFIVLQQADKHFKCTSHQEYVNFIFSSSSLQKIRGYFSSQPGQKLWRQKFSASQCKYMTICGTAYPSGSEVSPFSGFQ